MPRRDPKRTERLTFWREYRQELSFLAVFVVLLGLSFTLISLAPVNDGLIEPYTARIAEASGLILRWIGQDITMSGTVIRSGGFAVNIRNGCNGVEALLIFLAAVVAFPAPLGARVVGLVIGFVAIQAVNLVRVVALFLTGLYAPRFFDSSHTVIWQTVVILFSVVLWIVWANVWVPRAKQGKLTSGAG